MKASGCCFAEKLIGDERSYRWARHRGIPDVMLCVYDIYSDISGTNITPIQDYDIYYL